MHKGGCDFLCFMLHAACFLFVSLISLNTYHILQCRVGKAVSTTITSVKSWWCPPRALYLTGSLARGIQLSTTLAYTFQPSFGLGALVNAGAIISDRRWISCIVAGWFTSPKLWSFFGAKPPSMVTNAIEEKEIKTENAEEKKGWF